MAQVGHLGHHEVTLRGLQFQVMLLESGEYCCETIYVFFKCTGKNNYIIQVHQTVSKIHISRAHFHQALKCCWCIAQTKRHSVKFIKSQGAHLECCFGFCLPLRFPLLIGPFKCACYAHRMHVFVCTNFSCADPSGLIIINV